MAQLWLEVDERGNVLRRSEAVASLFDGFEHPITDLTSLFERRVDVRAAVARRAGAVRFGLGRGAERLTFDVEITSGAAGARLRLTQVAPLEGDAELGRILLGHAERHPDAHLVTDPDGVILWCDAAFAWLVGYDRADIVGRRALLFGSPAVPPRQVDAYWRNIYAMGVYSGSTLIRRSDGVDVPVQHSASAIKDADGRTTHLVGVMRDMSRDRELERLRGMDAAVALLGRLCGDHAHRLNNIAAEMVAICDGAMLSDDPASAGQALDRLQTLAGHLGNLGRQMLSVSTSGASNGPSDLGRVARDLGHTLASAAGEDGPPIEVNAPDAALWVNCAPDGLVRACIHLALRSLEGVAEGSSVQIDALEDYGEGLLRIRYTPTVTEREALRWLLPDGAVTGPVVNEFLSRAYGAGVNLQLDEERDGRIAICVRAPLAEVVPSPLRAAVSPQDSRWGRVVVADDNAALRELVAAALEGLFDEVVAVEDGVAAIEAVERVNGRVDLLIVDLRMPHRDGTAVLKEVATRWPSLPCIVVTGAAPDGFTHSAMAAGARAVLSKPFRLHELRAVVRSVMDGAHW